MNRITKTLEERKSELIEAAEELFRSKGYNKTTVNDIVKKINVAQGTFYYYFKSKEDIFLAVFDKSIKKSIVKLNKIVDCKDGTIMEKYMKMLEVQFKTIDFDQNLSIQLHNEENFGLHQKAIINTIKLYSPVYSRLLKKGVNEGILKTEYAEEVSEYFLIVVNYLFDPGIFQLEENEYKRKINALSNIMARALGITNEDFKLSNIVNKTLELNKKFKYDK
ncbi:TetR/AcrR family transcriptional regulator [Clostridium beijerinckii]|uniref:AcrR family transcriptional regulator n=1 Tax=Clostridium beijerinckii TaxID=1520 RepID=A0AAE5H1T2_CLOBE|nr:TetR/AcrR family transcriptional regulator [Clostridium beijerinckii]NSB12640.1 AcrR family transcriptional regulator [Clostridium beijerinckii]OOM20125.1 fatty acid metabolism regulator protein [Clostridium beijerinckii]